MPVQIAVESLPIPQTLPEPISENLGENLQSSESVTRGGIRDVFKHLVKLGKPSEESASVSAQVIPEARNIIRDGTDVGKMISRLALRGQQNEADDLMDAAMGRIPKKQVDKYGFTDAQLREYAEAAKKAAPPKIEGSKISGFKTQQEYIETQTSTWESYLYDKSGITTPKDPEGEISGLMSKLKKTTDDDERHALELQLDTITKFSSNPFIAEYFRTDDALRDVKDEKLTLGQYLNAKERARIGKASDRDSDIIIKAESAVPSLENPSKTLYVLLRTDRLDVNLTPDEKEAFACMREMVGRIAKAAGRDYKPGESINIGADEKRSGFKQTAVEVLQPIEVSTDLPEKTQTEWDSYEAQFRETGRTRKYSEEELDTRLAKIKSGFKIIAQ